MRSQSPIHGVGCCVASLGPSKLVNVLNTTSIKIVATE